jgi:hypothetical protein
MQQIALTEKQERWCANHYPAFASMKKWPTHKRAHEKYIATDKLDRKEPEKREVVA